MSGATDKFMAWHREESTALDVTRSQRGMLSLERHHVATRMHCTVSYMDNEWKVSKPQILRTTTSSSWWRRSSLVIILTVMMMSLLCKCRRRRGWKINGFLKVTPTISGHELINQPSRSTHCVPYVRFCVTASHDKTCGWMKMMTSQGQLFSLNVLLWVVMQTDSSMKFQWASIVKYWLLQSDPLSDFHFLTHTHTHTQNGFVSLTCLSDNLTC